MPTFHIASDFDTLEITNYLIEQGYPYPEYDLVSLGGEYLLQFDVADENAAFLLTLRYTLLSERQLELLRSAEERAQQDWWDAKP